MGNSIISFFPLIIILPILVVFIMIIYRMFKSAKINHKGMTILSIIIGLFPITPLALMATVAGIAVLGGGQLHIALFFLGGPAGLVSLLRALLGHVSKTNFWMLLYGGLIYTVLVFIAINGVFSEGIVTETISGQLSLEETALNIIISIYALLSLTIFPWHLWITNKALEEKAAKNQEVITR